MMIMHGQAAAMGMNASYAACARATRPPSEPHWKKSTPQDKFAAMLRILLVLGVICGLLVLMVLSICGSLLKI